MLAFGVEARLADLGEQRPVLLDRRGWHETGHPKPLETGNLPKDGALRQTGLGGTLARRLTEEHDGPDELVGALPPLAREQGDLVPVVGGVDARSR